MAHRLENGDKEKLLLARNGDLLFKEGKWAASQAIVPKFFPRVTLIWKRPTGCPALWPKSTRSKLKGLACTKLAKWYSQVEAAGSKSFNTVSTTLQNHYTAILNFFDKRSTNASGELFNAKIKAFRTEFRGVTSIEFFLFRLSNNYV